MTYGLIHKTPVEWYDGIAVKREDLCSPPPGPEFSKYRGVVEHIRKRPEKIIAVLDTYHSKAGIAVAYACRQLDKKCINFAPLYKGEVGWRPNQQKSRALGAELRSLPAGRSAILFYQARRQTPEGGYLMPNALKLAESVEANAEEAFNTQTEWFETIVIPVSSGTIAAGVIKGISAKGERPRYVIHMGYSRPVHMIEKWINSHVPVDQLHFVDEGYAYRDEARKGEAAPFPCNRYYDLKSWRWLLANRDTLKRPILFWNIGA